MWDLVPGQGMRQEGRITDDCLIALFVTLEVSTSQPRMTLCVSDDCEFRRIIPDV